MSEKAVDNRKSDVLSILPGSSQPAGRTVEQFFFLDEGISSSILFGVYVDGGFTVLNSALLFCRDEGNMFVGSRCSGVVVFTG